MEHRLLRTVVSAKLPLAVSTVWTTDAKKQVQVVTSGSPPAKLSPLQVDMGSTLANTKKHHKDFQDELGAELRRMSGQSLRGTSKEKKCVTRESKRDLKQSARAQWDV